MEKGWVRAWVAAQVQQLFLESLRVVVSYTNFMLLEIYVRFLDESVRRCISVSGNRLVGYISAILVHSLHVSIRSGRRIRIWIRLRNLCRCSCHGSIVLLLEVVVLSRPIEGRFHARYSGLRVGFSFRRRSILALSSRLFLGRVISISN
jgi:hypothetical protein